ncbi:hypothetical protein [Marinobacterium aestuariivivens]|uniref:Uncharacterized protein n=1 Tax=Marinobacterium aestuariivivens TaxID=1698799 RepID=A0ABW2A6Z3_9GAMM
MRQMEGSSDILLESHFIWHEIRVGDLISLEANLEDDGVLQLRHDHPYEVLAKLDLAPGNQVFVVQSDVTGDLVYVHPFLVSSYDNSPEPARIM